MTPREWNSALGANIRKTRKAAATTVVALAGKAGMHATSLARCERGQQQISSAQWAAVADALDVAPSSLLPNLPNLKVRLRRAA
jgi:transcriptional regulator with XRE-family HTH domain